MANDQFQDKVCPMCMNPPHNCRLLKCSSQGCHSYICDTNKLFSNCLERFQDSGRSQCPLCKGELLGNYPVDPQTQAYFDDQKRACTLNGCSFYGSYKELQTHVQQHHTYHFLVYAKREEDLRNPNAEPDPPLPSIRHLKFPPPPQEPWAVRLLHPVYKFFCRLLGYRD